MYVAHDIIKNKPFVLDSTTTFILHTGYYKIIAFYFRPLWSTSKMSPLKEAYTNWSGTIKNNKKVIFWTKSFGSTDTASFSQAIKNISSIKLSTRWAFLVDYTMLSLSFNWMELCFVLYWLKKSPRPSLWYIMMFCLHLFFLWRIGFNNSLRGKQVPGPTKRGAPEKKKHSSINCI